jgi:protein TonB
MTARLASVLTLSAVALAHGAFLSFVFSTPATKPVDIELPAVQGVLIAAPPAEMVQAPAARETPPTPKEPEITPPKPEPKPEPAPKPKPKPKPKPETPPKPKPPVKAPPSEKAISAPPEEVPDAADPPPTAPSPSSSDVATEKASDTLGAPVVPPRVDARRMDNPAPAYPRQSRRLREEGTVVLELLILEDGTVSKARIETSSGHSRLDETALAAVKRWRYVPATRGGKPIAYTYLQPVVFSLTN